MFIHKKSGRAYKVRERKALVQINNVWVDAVIYVSAVDANLPVFIREAKDFDEKFVECDYKETTPREFIPSNL